MGRELCVCSTYKISYKHTVLTDRVEFFANFLIALSDEDNGSLEIMPEIDESLMRIEFPATCGTSVSAWLAARNPEEEVDICDNPTGVTYGTMKRVFDEVFESYDKDNGYIVLEWV